MPTGRDRASAFGERASAQKLFAPKPYPGAIRRQALVEQIIDTTAPPITFLQAPAGHGKSTVLQQVKAHYDGIGFATGWLTFDEADNDIRTCSEHLQALMRSMLRRPSDASSREPADGERERRPRSDWFLNDLASAADPPVLFLDEFQALRSPAILAFFRDLFERLPEGVRLCIGSRSVPDVGLVRLVVNHQALLLRADDLRFSPAEVATFFSRDVALEIRPDEVEAIYRQTEGWPAALQLFRLTLGSPTLRRSLPSLETFRPRELAEYLAENVLRLQTDTVQEFLLGTSLLRRLTAPLCNAVLGRTDSQEMLLFLERSGLFVRMLDSGAQWFCYHTLFSTCLAERCTDQSRDQARAVHRRAAEWFRDNGIYDQALYHALEIEDFEFAAGVLDVWASTLVATGHLTTVERWLDRIPLEYVMRRPMLAIKAAWTFIFLRRQLKAAPLFAALDGTPQDEAGAADVVRSMAAIMRDDMTTAFGFVDRVVLRGSVPQGFRCFELGAAANLAAYRAMVLGDLDEAREFIALGSAYSDAAGATFSGGYALSLTGVHLMMQGRLPHSLARLRAGMALERVDLDKSFSSASLASCYINALYEAHEFGEAETCFNQFSASIAESGLLDFVAVAYLSMARIHEARGRMALAVDVLDRAAAIGHASGWPRLVRIVTWERVRMALVNGEAYRAEVLATRLRQERVEGPHRALGGFSEDGGGEAIGEIRLAIHTGQVDRAAEGLARELPLAVAQGRVHRQIKLYVLDALCHVRIGGATAAHRSVRTALRLAEPGGFVSVFLEEGQAVLQLLKEEQATYTANGVLPLGVSIAFIDRLLGAARVVAGDGRWREETGTLEPLSDRELQILLQLTNGASNRETARKISVSENTVKYHLKNIYIKLNVSGRIQAINAARDLGLFQ